VGARACFGQWPSQQPSLTLAAEPREREIFGVA
jgi:hypothetical protein